MESKVEESFALVSRWGERRCELRSQWRALGDKVPTRRTSDQPEEPQGTRAALFRLVEDHGEMHDRQRERAVRGKRSVSHRRRSIPDPLTGPSERRAQSTSLESLARAWER